MSGAGQSPAPRCSARCPRYPSRRAPVAQWIEQRFPKPRAHVRFMPGASAPHCGGPLARITVAVCRAPSSSVHASRTASPGRKRSKRTTSCDVERMTVPFNESRTSPRSIPPAPRASPAARRRAGDHVKSRSGRDAMSTPRNGVAPTWTVAVEVPGANPARDRPHAVDRDRVAVTVDIAGGRGCVHADHPFRGIEQRPARVTLAKICAGLDEPRQADGAAPSVANLDRDTPACHGAALRGQLARPAGVADRDHLVTDRDGRGVAERHRLEPAGSGEPEQRDVGRDAVAEDTSTVGTSALGDSDSDLRCPADDVVVRQHLAGRGDRPSRFLHPHRRRGRSASGSRPRRYRAQCRRRRRMARPRE